MSGNPWVAPSPPITFHSLITALPYRVVARLVTFELRVQARAWRVVRRAVRHECTSVPDRGRRRTDPFSESRPSLFLGERHPRRLGLHQADPLLPGGGRRVEEVAVAVHLGRGRLHLWSG